MSLSRIFQDDFFRSALPSLRQMNRVLLEDLPALRGLPSSLRTQAQEAWVPRCDAKETENDYVISAEMPGIKKEDINVELRGNSLRIKGEMRQEKESKGGEEEGSYHLSERMFGSFERTFSLPKNADLQKIVANHQDGILSIKIAKAAPTLEEAATKRIQIE